MIPPPNPKKFYFVFLPLVALLVVAGLYMTYHTPRCINDGASAILDKYE